MGLPPSQELEGFYLQRRPRTRQPALLALRALHRALAAGEEPTVGTVAEAAHINHSTVVRLIRGLRGKGFLSTSGSVPITGGGPGRAKGRTRFTYEVHWPPLPPERGR